MIPAILVAGALAAGPVSTPAGPASPAAVHVVVPGDTLWAITAEAFGNPLEWPRLYAANTLEVGPNPDLIIPGERIRLTLAPRPASGRAIEKAAVAPAPDGDDGGQAADSIGGGATPAPGATGGGTLSCSGLEALWQAAGGPGWAAFTAAEIAIAESGGRQYALSPTSDYGYWQINISHGVLATFDAYGNARAAVIISDGGRDWSPWTTYETGAYRGLC